MSYHFICETCKKDFSCWNKGQRFCSRDCFGVTRHSTKKENCLRCNQPFTPQETGQIYCGRECYLKNIGEGKHPLNRKGAILNGYKFIFSKNKRIQEHRYIMEQHLGRPLLSTEKVHHKDHNKLNNSIDNLEIVTATQHAKIHMTHLFSSDTEKQCCRCFEIKPRPDFSKRNSKGRDKNQSVCKVCSAAYMSNRPKPTREGRPRKITPEIMEKIRNEYIPRKFSYPKLAERYSISPQTVYLIVSGKIN